MNTRTDNHHLTPGLEEEATRAVACCFSGMPERMAQEPVRCGVHHLGTLWSVSGEIARAMLRFAAEQQPTADARLREALMTVLGAVRDYLPPDGISQQDCLNRVIAAVDSPQINPVIRSIENARS